MSWDEYNAAGEEAYRQGHYAEAENHYKAALKEAETFRPQDPRLATTLNNLAELYRIQGRYAEAEPLHQRALVIREKALGPQHPDVATAVKEFRQLAQQGNAWAQFNLGIMYSQGRGVPQDDAEAIRWYRRAAEQGDAEAQLNLGYAYEHGQGVPQDDGEAVRWYRLAAEQGNAWAQFNLGIMYSQGRGVPQDDAEAIRWYRRAAEQGDAEAQLNLGIMYSQGRGVPQDYVQAHMWVNLAAAQGIEGARKARDILAEQMTPAQIAKAQRLAGEWKSKKQSRFSVAHYPHD